MKVEADRKTRFPSSATATVVDVLALMSRTGPLSIRSAARQLSTPRSTVNRIVETLCMKGLVQRTSDGQYEIGQGLIDLVDDLKLGKMPQVAMSIMRDLSRRTGETVNLAVLRDAHMFIVAAVHSPQSLRMVSDVGTLDPLHASSLGKAYLAELPAQHRRQLMAAVNLESLTVKSITDPGELEGEIRHTAQRGYAIDNEETVVGVRCIGAAIVRAEGEPIGAISVAGPTSRMSAMVLETYGPMVAGAARTIGDLMAKPRRLGC